VDTSWSHQISQCFSIVLVPANALDSLPTTHDTRSHLRVIRSSFQRIVFHYLYFGCLVGTSKCSRYGITMYCKANTQVHGERVRERKWKVRADWLTLIYFAKASRIYTGARVNNSRSNVYRGDFRKPVNSCEFTHVSVLMRTWLADSHFAALRVMYWCPTERERRCIRPCGNAGYFLSA
jgi:hypothetical protein